MWAAGNSRSESRLDGRRDPKQSRSVGEQQSHQGRSYRHQSGIQSPPPPRSERKVWKREITNLCCYEVNVCVLSPGCEAQRPQLRPSDRASARVTADSSDLGPPVLPPPGPAAPLWRCEGRARAEFVRGRSPGGCRVETRTLRRCGVRAARPRAAPVRRPRVDCCSL